MRQRCFHSFKWKTWKYYNSNQIDIAFWSWLWWIWAVQSIFALSQQVTLFFFECGFYSIGLPTTNDFYDDDSLTDTFHFATFISYAHLHFFKKRLVFGCMTGCGIYAMGWILKWQPFSYIPFETWVYVVYTANISASVGDSKPFYVWVLFAVVMNVLYCRALISFAMKSLCGSDFSLISTYGRQSKTFMFIIWNLMHLSLTICRAILVATFIHLIPQRK